MARSPRTQLLLRLFMTFGISVLVAACGGSGGSTPRTPTQPAPTPTPQPGPPVGTLRGTVIDTDSGAPVAGASLSVSLGETPTVLTTDSAGNWEFSRTGATPTSIPIELSAAGFVPRRTQLSGNPAPGISASI